MCIFFCINFLDKSVPLLVPPSGKSKHQPPLDSHQGAIATALIQGKLWRKHDTVAWIKMDCDIHGMFLKVYAISKV